MIVADKMEQGSEEWLNIRKGRATASKASEILTPDKLEVSKSAVKYMRKLARECVVDDPMEFAGNKYTDWGNDTEDEARAEFERIMEVDVMEVGFVNRADNAPVGCSPDGLILFGEFEPIEGVTHCQRHTPQSNDYGLEIKCPQVDTHVGYLLAGALPNTYKLQVHWSMAVTGLKSWYFMSYFPGLKPLILKVEWDETTDKMTEAIDDFIPQYIEERKRVLAAIMIEEEAV